MSDETSVFDVLPRDIGASRLGSTGAIDRRDKAGIGAAIAEMRAQLGWLPALMLVAAGALAIVAVSDAAARRSLGWGELLFWIGLIVLFAPIAMRLLLPGVSRGERIGLVVMLGLGIYLVEVIGAPRTFTEFAELDQLRTASDILATHHLFHANPIAETNPYYPGLSIVTNAIATLAGTSIYTSGIIVIAVARALLVVFLFLFLERLGGSARIAGVGAAIYAANPNYLQFSTQFSYESLGLTLLLGTLLCLSNTQDRGRAPGAWFGIAVLLGISIVVTHHVTAIVLVTVCLTWTLFAVVRRDTPGVRWRVLAAYTLVLASALAAWLATAGEPALPYLASIVGPAASGLINIVVGGSHAKTLFQASTGQLAPLWERVAGFASVGIILLALPAGVLAFWRRRRRDPLALVVCCLALIYPPTLALRLTQAGSETSNRSSDFVFLGIGLLLALAACTMYLPEDRAGRARSHFAVPSWVRSQSVRVGLFALATTILFVGGVTIGTPRYSRQPGPFIVGADSRSVTAEGLAVADWMRTYEGPGNRVVTDRATRQLLGSYGGQDPLERNGGPLPGVQWVPVYDLITATRVARLELEVIRHKQVRFVVIDRRLSTALPIIGIYFERSEPGAYAHRQPLSPVALSKFDKVRGVDRVLDAGDIRVYDVAGAQ